MPDHIAQSQLRESLSQSLVITSVLVFVVKWFTGLAFGPLAVMGAIVFLIALGLELRLRRHPRRGQ